MIYSKKGLVGGEEEGESIAFYILAHSYDTHKPELMYGYIPLPEIQR